MVRLALISATALLLALSGGLVFWLGGGRQSGTAWASADAFELQYTIFDVPRIQGGKEPIYEKDRNQFKFEQSVLGWAKENGIPVIRDYASQQSEPRFIFLSLPGSFGAITSDISFASNWIKLVGMSDEERSDLEARLAPLPGVMPPTVRHYTVYYEITSPQETLPSRKVVINGKVFNYPVDFTKNEAHGLNNYLLNWDPGQIWLVAFLKLSPVEDGQPDRLSLGEAYQIEMDPEGSLRITTLAKVWNEGRAWLAKRPESSRKGFRQLIPRNNPEKDFDPLKALKDTDDDRLGMDFTREFPVTTSLTYLMYPNGRLLAEGAPKFTSQELEKTRARLAAMSSVLQDLLKRHPEYWDTRRHHWRVNFDANGSPWQQLYFCVYVTDREGELAREVKAVLAAAVPGLREPAEQVSDVRKRPPLPDWRDQDKIFQPQLEKPNPAMWFAYQGWILDYRVLGVADEGQQFQLETAQAGAFRDAVTRWAGEAGVEFAPTMQQLLTQGEPLGNLMQQGATPALFITGPGGGGFHGRFMESVFTLHLAAPGEQLLKSLQLALAGLQGVPEPRVEPAKFYVHQMHPANPLTGGDLVLEGKRYRFPYDFAWEEALSVHYLQPRPGHVTYKAFYTLVHPDRNRITFPDVVRVSIAADGSVEVTTVLKDWPEGRKLYKPRPNSYGGAEVRLSPGEETAGYDPLKALTSELHFYDRKSTGQYIYSLKYFLTPKDQWLDAVKDRPEEPAALKRKAIYDQVDKRLTAWLDSHPEYKETESDWAGMGWYEFPYGGQYLAADVWFKGDDDAVVKELLVLLKGIPGLPEPVQSREEIKPSSP